MEVAGLSYDSPPVPVIRPFRALRFDPQRIGDLGPVVSPPYDVISPPELRTLLDRHPRNVVRLDLPPEEPGDGPDDRYRRAARALAEWRSDGTLRKDPRPSVYVYEQSYLVPGTDVRRTQRGFFARLRLETLGQGAGVLPHERTMTAPKEDRYKLLRATGTNLSPMVGLFGDRSGEASGLLATATAGPTAGEVIDADGVGHRLWVVPSDPDAAPADDPARRLSEIAGAEPITIADGHHRYETALRYRDERRMTRSCEEDPAFDYLLALLLESERQELTVLPTHRVVRGLGDAGVEGLLAGARGLFDVVPASSAAAVLEALPGHAPAEGGRFGLVTRQGAAWLSARRELFDESLPPGGEALRRLDVTLLETALDRLAGIDPAAIAAGGRLAYTKSAVEAVDQVSGCVDGADAAFLLDPTPVAAIVAVARDGDLMPQKSTFFYPKPLTGLVFNPHEW
jgi:uncharacterized protein (DUF1015 family)